MGAENGIMIDGRPPREFVDQLIEALPGLREDHRVLASLSQQLPLLMEAAPRPLLRALKQMLGGDGAKLKPIFQDAKENATFWSSSPHTGLLWALELIGHDPEFLLDAAEALARLDEIDPGGTLSNRPLGSLKALFLTWLPATNASHELRFAVLDRLISSHASVAWKLLLSLIPRQGQAQFNSAKPRFREAGASDREELTYPLMFDIISGIVSRLIALAEEDESRWVELLKELHHIPQRDRGGVVDYLSACLVRMGTEARSHVWNELSRTIRRHRAFSNANWALSAQEIEKLERLADSLAPTEPTDKFRYLFIEGLPEISDLAAGNVMERVEEARRTAVKQILDNTGIEGLVEFASHVDSPRSVGAIFGSIAENPKRLIEAIRLNAARPSPAGGFGSSVSSAAMYRFPHEWPSTVEELLRNEELPIRMLQELVEWWPMTKTTWEWIARFGEEEEKKYWQSKQPWGIDAKGPDLIYILNQYLHYNRPEFIIESLSDRAAEIPSEILIQTLTAFLARVASNPEILHWQAVPFHLQQVFRSLQEREDVPLGDAAALDTVISQFFAKYGTLPTPIRLSTSIFPKIRSSSSK
jgi:hypothetical protein